MKKYLISLFAGVGMVASAAFTTTVTVPPNTFTNLLSLSGSGYAIVTSAAITANSTNASVSFYDTTTNSLTYVVPAYTNITSYATNWVQTWTNYYGVTNSWTNISLVDVTNSVAASTNNYPVKIAAAALANTTTVLNPLYATFESGIYVTNTSTGIATVTIQYRQ